MELPAIIKNEIPKLMSKRDSIDIHLICEQNWVKQDRTFELELIEWVSRIPINQKNCSDNKRPIDSEEEDVSRTNTTAPMTMAKTTSSLTPLSKNLSYSQYDIDWDKGEEYREKAALVKTTSMRDISQIECEDDDDSKMIPPRIIPTRYKIPKKKEVDTSRPVSTDSTTPVSEVKKDRLWDEHGEPIPHIRAYQFSLFRR
uniref:Uncharacterized protein n=1 Tax=Romanomermis culicivorax TaxID=13658 RepID=A0A915I6Q5_ROMCU